MAIAQSVLDLIGKTPLVKLHTVVQHPETVHAEVVAKLEYYNPASSVKDRLAKAMIEAAEARGILTPKCDPAQIIIEPTSGNTGIGLALVAGLKGYRLILAMPESVSNERKLLLRGLGATLVLTPAAEGMRGAVARAEALQAETPGAVILQQFSNPAGPEVHARTTAQELWDDCAGQLDAVVAGVGTGGTISGLGRRLKELNPAITVCAVEPAESAVLSGEPAHPHPIQGIGAGFVPDVLDRSVVDEVIKVSGAEAMHMARRLIREEGILCGISSGAAVQAALRVAARPAMKGKRVACIVCDTADRYLSTALFTEMPER